MDDLAETIEITEHAIEDPVAETVPAAKTLATKVRYDDAIKMDLALTAEIDIGAVVTEIDPKVIVLIKEISTTFVGRNKVVVRNEHHSY